MRIGFGWIGLVLLSGAAAAWPSPSAVAADALVIRAGPPDGADDRRALDLARILAADPKDAVALSVEASQGSTQNIVEAPLRGARSLFTAVPGMVEAAVHGDKPFGANPRYGDIRALFPLPFPSVHWVVSADSGVDGFAGLAGRPFMAGPAGSFAAAATEALFKLLGLAGKVKLVDRGEPLVALTSGEAVGFAAAAAVPDRGIAALARSEPIRLLSLGRDDLDRMLAGDDTLAAMVIPARTYAGLGSDVLTVARPAGVYTTTAMGEVDAYRLTRGFWEAKKALEAQDPQWAAVTPETLIALAVKLHPGALRYYREAGIAVPPGLR